MNKEELKTIVAQMLREMHGGEQPEPAVKASEYKPTASDADSRNRKGISPASVPSDVNETVSFVL